MPRSRVLLYFFSSKMNFKSESTYMAISAIDDRANLASFFLAALFLAVTDCILTIHCNRVPILLGLRSRQPIAFGRNPLLLYSIYLLHPSSATPISVNAFILIITLSMGQKSPIVNRRRFKCDSKYKEQIAFAEGSGRAAANIKSSHCGAVVVAAQNIARRRGKGRGREAQDTLWRERGKKSHRRCRWL